MSSNSPDTTKQELEVRLAHLERENEQLKRAKRRVGLSFHRVPETGSQIEALTNGQFPYFEYISSCSYTLADRHADEKAKGSPLSESTDGNITLIEGDNLPVLTALQQTHRGRIDVIYIDPPYNTGNNDFIYNDARISSVIDIEGISLDDYERTLDGKARTVGKDDPERHSLWLSFMERRLFLAKELLSDTGVIFVSIDDNEHSRLKLMMDEIFGIDNFVANLIWKKKQGGGNDSTNFVTEHEYVLVYGKTPAFSSLLDPMHELDIKMYPFEDEKGRYSLIRLDKSSLRYSESLNFEIKDNNGVSYRPRVVGGIQSCWRWSKKKVEADFDDLVFRNGGVYTKAYMPLQGIKPKSLLIDPRFGRSETGNDAIKKLIGKNSFSFPKPVSLIQHLLRVTASKNAIILDFFAGSGTTGHAVAELNKEDGGNRQCILVTHGDENGKNIAEDVTAERMKRVLSGENWADGKSHEPLSGEMNYYKLVFTERQSNPEITVECLQSKFIGYVALQQDVIAAIEQPDSTHFTVLKNSKKTVVMVKDQNYLEDEFDEFNEILETLQREASEKESLSGNHIELVIYIPSSSDFDEYGFEDIGWKYIPLPLEYLKSHAKLINRMKANGTLLPISAGPEDVIIIDPHVENTKIEADAEDGEN